MHPHHTALPHAEDSTERRAVFSSHGKSKVFNLPSKSLKNV